MTVSLPEIPNEPLGSFHCWVAMSHSDIPQQSQLRFQRKLLPNISVGRESLPCGRQRFVLLAVSQIGPSVSVLERAIELGPVHPRSSNEVVRNVSEEARERRMTEMLFIPFNDWCSVFFFGILSENANGDRS